MTASFEKREDCSFQCDEANPGKVFTEDAEYEGLIVNRSVGSHLPEKDSVVPRHPGDWELLTDPVELHLKVVASKMFVQARLQFLAKLPRED